MQELRIRPNDQLQREHIVAQLAINEPAFDDDLAKQVAAFNDEVAQATVATTASDRAVSEAIDRASGLDDPDALLNAIDSKRRHLISDAQKLARLWQRRSELIELLFVDHQEAANRADAEAARLQSEKREALEAIGYTAETLKMVTLDALVNVGHPEVRSALEEASVRRSGIGQLRKDKRITSESVQQALGYVRATADRIASGKV